MKSVTIVTHGANFHSDDIFAVATLLTLCDLDKNEVKVIRTLQPEKYPQADYIVDIGRVYSPKHGRFDHHQEGGAGYRSNGVPYSSFGLVWKSFGKKIAGGIYGADWVDRHIVQAIDAMDSGMYLYTPVIDDISPFLFQEYFRTACDVLKGNGNENLPVVDTLNKNKVNIKNNLKKFDKEFMRLVIIAKDVLRVFIEKSKQRESVAREAKIVYKKAKDKRIMISDIFVPTTFSEFKAPKYIEPLVFIYPDLRGGWSAKVVPSGEQTYDSRMKFPKNWRGKNGTDLAKVTGVSDAKFCHNAGFLAVAGSKEGVLEMVKKALK